MEKIKLIIATVILAWIGGMLTLITFSFFFLIGIIMLIAVGIDVPIKFAAAIYNLLAVVYGIAGAISFGWLSMANFKKERG